jgi:hypothetical protein
LRDQYSSHLLTVIAPFDPSATLPAFRIFENGSKEGPAGLLPRMDGRSQTHSEYQAKAVLQEKNQIARPRGREILTRNQHPNLSI